MMTVVAYCDGCGIAASAIRGGMVQLPLGWAQRKTPLGRDVLVCGEGCYSIIQQREKSNAAQEAGRKSEDV